MHIIFHHQVCLITELEERLPSVRLYFFKKFNILKKYDIASPLMYYFQSAKFDNKVKAVKDSNENNTKKYQVYHT